MTLQMLLTPLNVRNLFTNISMPASLQHTILFYINSQDLKNKQNDFKVPLRRKFLFLFSPFSRSNPFNEYVIAKLAIN